MAGGGDSDVPSPASAIERIVSNNLERLAVRSRALVLVAAIIAVVALGLAAVVDDQISRVSAIGGALLLMLVITVLIYRISRASTGGDETEDHASIAKALNAVNGRWWQLVLSEKTPGISLIGIELSVFPTRHRMSGRKYTPDGHQMASWKSRAVGLMSIEPVELFYYFTGSYAGPSQPVSGIGIFEFDSPSGTGVVDRGTGWFTTGDVERRDLRELSRVHLERVKSEEQSTLESDDHVAMDLISSRYRAMSERFRARQEPVASSPLDPQTRDVQYGATKNVGRGGTG